MSAEAWIAVITAFVGGGGLTALTGYLQSRYKDRRQASLEERQQPIDHYAKIVTGLEMRLDKLDEDHREEMKAVVDDLKQCQEHHVTCEREMGFLKGQMHELSKLVLRKNDGPMVTVTGAGDLRSIEAMADSGQIATFDPNDSTKIPKEER